MSDVRLFHSLSTIAKRWWFIVDLMSEANDLFKGCAIIADCNFGVTHTQLWFASLLGPNPHIKFGHDQPSHSRVKYSVATYFNAFHAARATCQVGPQMGPIRLQLIFIEFIPTHFLFQWKSCENQIHNFEDMCFSKMSTGQPAGRPFMLRFLRYQRARAKRESISSAVCRKNLSMSDPARPGR